MDTELSTTTVTAKTPLFAAPELLANGAATVASDVYGLAALLYALLAGRPAFAGGAASNIWAVMDRVRTEAPPAIDRVPQQVMEVIASAMAKNPNDRPATAKLFGQYLQFAMHEARNPQTDRPRTHARPPVLTHDPAAHTVDLVDAPPEPKRAGLPHRRQALPILASVATVLVVAFGIMQLLPGGSLDRNATGVDSVEAASTEVDATADAIVAGERIAPTAAPTARKTAESVSSDETPDASSEIDSSSAESEPTTSTSTPYATSRFAMQMPTGWSTVQENVDVGYGYRTHLVGPGGNFVIIDTTPHDRATPGVTIRQSAEQVAASVPSATSVVHEQIGNKDAYWFKYMGNDGSLRIDIFFTVDGDGYAVVGGSFSDPDSAYRIANDVVASLESRS